METSGGARGGLGWAKPTLKCVEPTQKFFKVSEKIDDLFIQVMPQHTTASYDKDKDSCLFLLDDD